MQFFYWNKSFEIGIAEIDQQHRTMVDFINTLATALVEGGKLPEVRGIADQLLQYATSHFRDEEKLIASCSLPAEEQISHRIAHARFVEKTQEILLRPDLFQEEVSQQVLEFLTTWLISHILGSDLKIVRSAAEGGKVLTEVDELLAGISPVERMLLGALTETERRFRLISDHAPVLIWVSDATGVRGFFNRAWSDFVGVIDEKSLSEGWSRFVHPEDYDRYQAQIRAVLAGFEPVEVEYRIRDYHGKYHWFLERMLPRIDTTGVLLGVIASATNITSIKQAEALLNQSNRVLEQEVARRTEQLELLMLTDPLTGVGNRRMVTKRLEEEVVRSQRYHRPLTIAFIDIDLFKNINDTYGHAIGDSVLINVAQSLGACVRDCDIIGRYGGEEFVVLLPETVLDVAHSVAERMRRDIELLNPLHLSRSVTVSIGLAELMDNETGDALLARSDRALYLAKKSGRNCCILDR